MRLDVFTLFPEAFDWFQTQRSIQNALCEGNEFRLFNYRDTTPLTAGQVDDSPYGGGAGMVLRVDVVDAALQATYGEGPRPRTVLLSPTGPLLDDPIADELVAEPHVALLCGRYEGFDDRVHRHLADDEISIGRYVLAGGELPAMVVADVLMRKLPGALGHEDSRRSCFRGTTRRCGGGGWSRAGFGPSSSKKTRSSYHSATARFPHLGPGGFFSQQNLRNTSSATHIS